MSAPMLKNSFAAILIVLFAGCLYVHADEGILFREEFESLDDWEPLHFPDIDRHSSYQTRVQDGVSVLVARSANSASALVHQRTFDVSEHPVIRWRWKVENVYEKGDYRRKSGDDYPIRVHVLFAYDPERASIMTRLRYGAVKAIYGRYPPHAGLNYIWANRADATERRFSSYTDRSVLIPLEQGPQKAGQWVEERVNAMADYRAAFGEDPPAMASVAVMTDSDNTGEAGAAYIDFIEVRK